MMKYIGLRSPLVLILLFSFFFLQAQITHRDLLQKFSSQQLAGALIPRDQFRPFPQRPDEWKKVLPDSLIQKLIGNGESALKKEFPNIPATVMLEFVRTGNRTHLENLSFGKRVELWNLVLAESVEGKGRFVDHIVDGIWSICEESFWGVSAHLGAQEAGVGLPDAEDPIVDLFAAETGAVLAWAPWIVSNYLTAVLLLEDKEEERVADVYRGIRVIDRYIDGLGEDGGCEEGPTYWSAAGGCVYDALNLLYDATGGS